MGFNIKDVFKIILLVCTLFLFGYLFYLFKKSSSPPKPGDILTPDKSGNNNRVDCMTKRTTCDPNNHSSCSDSCNNPDEMKCVKITDISKNINSQNSEYVCLPKGPDTSCNTDHGGVNVWSGYGFTDQKEWSCLCTLPQLYGGPNCETLNPSYCANGNLKIIKKTDSECKREDGYQIFGGMCLKCDCGNDTNKKLMMRSETNTPICVSQNPKDGGGYMGLYGNYVSPPDWKNVYYKYKIGESEDDWANLIKKEFNSSVSVDEIKTILNSYTQLNQNIVDQLTAKGLKSKTSFDPGYHEDKVYYTYFENAYIP